MGEAAADLGPGEGRKNIGLVRDGKPGGAGGGRADGLKLCARCETYDVEIGFFI